MNVIPDPWSHHSLQRKPSLLDYNTVQWCRLMPTFQRTVLPLPPGSRVKASSLSYIPLWWYLLQLYCIIEYIPNFYRNVKCTLVQALRLCTGRTTHRGSRGIALPFHDYGTRRGEESASLPGRSLPPGKTRYPLYRRKCWPQGRSGQVRKISPPPGFDPRTVQPVASRYTDYATRPTFLLYQCQN